MYVNMLMNGCEAFKRRFFEDNFKHLQKLDYRRLTKRDFLRQLKYDCDVIGPGKNLGELKSYVLFQTLRVKSGEQIYVFCSDDKNARNGIITLGGAKCIGVLSAFLWLYRDGILSKEDAQPYVRAYLDLCRKYKQKTFKVYDDTSRMRICRIPCEQVFEDMYADKLEMLKNGNLKYRC